MRKLDVTGQRFGKLVAIKYLESDETGRAIWLFQCDCGNKKQAQVKEIKRNAKRNSTVSCGCARGEGGRFEKRHGDYGKEFYIMWKNLKTRCTNENHASYKYYGGRGIIYDPKWKTYECFKEQMYLKYLYAKKQLNIKDISLERKDNESDYCFENCIFIDLLDQGKNKRHMRWFKAISPDGKIYFDKNATEFCRQHKIKSPSHVHECLRGERKEYQYWTFKYVQ